MKSLKIKAFVAMFALMTPFMGGCDGQVKDTVLQGLQDGTQTVITSLINAAFTSIGDSDS